LTSVTDKRNRPDFKGFLARWIESYRVAARFWKIEWDDMANSPQARKRVKQAAKRTEINMARRSRVRTFIRKVEEAIASGDREAASSALRAAQPEIVRGAVKGVMHKNTAARKVSRLAQRVRTMTPLA
jgi:small subunit ribosomal protein S20